MPADTDFHAIKVLKNSTAQVVVQVSDRSLYRWTQGWMIELPALERFWRRDNGDSFRTLEFSAVMGFVPHQAADRIELSALGTNHENSPCQK